MRWICEITSVDRVLQFASISFDTHIEEIYPCLLQGGTLVLRNDEMLVSAGSFLEHCARISTVIKLPTAYWHALTAEVPATAWSRLKICDL